MSPQPATRTSAPIVKRSRRSCLTVRADRCRLAGGCFGGQPADPGSPGLPASPSKHRPKGARALTAEQLRELLGKLATSGYCTAHDLVNPITLLITTSLRRSELLGLR